MCKSEQKLFFLGFSMREVLGVDMCIWIMPYRLNSDLVFKISILVIGFIAVGALVAFYGYTTVP